jgi:hypothetical protein
VSVTDSTTRADLWSSALAMFSVFDFVSFESAERIKKTDMDVSDGELSD